MFDIISYLYQYTMASINLANCLSRYIVIRADGEGVPISFLLGSDGVALVTVVRLGI
jgi:hypothetical protein